MYNRYYPYLYNRSENVLPPCPPPKPPPPKRPKKKLDFKSLKKDTCKSLNDVEYFLNNFRHTWKYIKLIKFLK